MKVCINVCYGGFGLSHAGMLHYAKLKGITVYPAKNEYRMWDYWIVKDHVKLIKFEDLMKLSSEERDKYYQLYHDQKMPNDSGISRDDLSLIQTVEELGKKSWGDCAELKVVEIPDDADWYISEHDGHEHIAEHHRTWG